ncbi:MAG TPA: DUF2012 domain-containing protein [Terriglobia bacterium]
MCCSVLRATLLIACGLWGTHALAQVMPQRRPEVNLPDGRSLYTAEGHVVALDGRTPIANVRVTLHSIKGTAVSTQVTSDDGQFAFSDLPSGLYAITASHPAYQEQTYSLDITVMAPRDIRIALVPREGPSAPTAQQLRPLPVWATRVPEDARQKYEAGTKELQKGKNQPAVEAFLKAVELYPDYASAHSALGMSYLGLRKEKEAQAAFAAALKVDDNLPEACIGMASLHNAARRFAEALPLLQRALAMVPQQWRVHYELGQAHLGLQDFPQAEQSLLQARKLHPEFARTYLLLINVLASQEKLPEALAAMDEYLKRFPSDSFAPQVRAKRDTLRQELAKSPKP